MLLLALFLSTIAIAESTPSVWSCPLVPISPLQPLQYQVGEDCPAGSFVHYYNCCDDNPFQCCFHFETWAIVVFGMLCLGGLAAVLFFSGRLLLQQRE